MYPMVIVYPEIIVTISVLSINCDECKKKNVPEYRKN